MPYTLREDGTRIYYEVTGDGLPLVLVIGLGGSTESWQRQVPDFSQKFQVITIDNRGAGKSDKPDAPYSMPMFADDVAAVLDELGVRRVLFLGVSMGGLIVQELYHRRPDLVAALVLACTGVGAGDPEYVYPDQHVMDVLSMQTDPQNPRPTAEKKAEIFYHPDYIAQIPQFVDRMLESSAQNPQPGYANRRQLEACILRDPQQWNSPRLSKITVPVLVYHGEDDVIWPLANARYLAEHIPAARLEIMENAAHMFFIEKPEEFNQTVLSFLQKVPR